MVAGVDVRRLGAGDREALKELYDGLSDTSRALRFGVPLPRWPGRLLEWVSAVDDSTHIALGAFVAGSMIGVVHRVVTDDADTWDVALAVADAYQRRGIGSRLLDAALEDGREHGVAAFSFTLAGGNVGMARLLARRGVRIRYRSGSGEALWRVAA